MRRYMFSLFICIVLLSTYGLAMADYACQYSFSNGSGANLFQYCISRHGNVVEFTFPFGETPIFTREGYALCDSRSVNGFDAGFTEAGCGSPTVNSTSPLTITRNCGCIQFKQQFTRNITEKELTITMTVKNICPFTINNVQVARYFDGDMGGNGGSDDKYGSFVDSVFAVDRENPSYGLTLTALTFGTPHDAIFEDYGNWDPNGGRGQSARKCFPTSTYYEGCCSGLGDYVGRIVYSLGDLTSNQSKTVKVVYGRK